jgi:hypothetical protein
MPPPRPPLKQSARVENASRSQSLVIAGAIFSAGALIALAIALTFRFSVTSAPPRAAAVQLDRWTGEMRWCLNTEDERPNRMRCENSD